MKKQHRIKRIISNKELVALFVVAFFLFAGVVQYAFGLQYVLQLTPLVIGILTALTVLFWDVQPRRKVALACAAMVIGMIAEIIGVNTGLLFGTYVYGEAMGIQLAGVPVLIAITWLFVSVAAWQLASLSSYSPIKTIIIAAWIVVLFDVVLEQYATAFGLWSWRDGIIPLKNYVSWFLVSVCISILYSKYSQQGKPSLFGAAILPLIMSYFWLMLLVR
jgi:putative membrane protein